MNAAEIVRSLGGEWRGNYGLAPCPVCQPEGKRDQRALSVMDKGGYPFVTCFKSCSSIAIKKALGVESGDVSRPDTEELRRREAAAKARQEKAAQLAEYLLSRAVRKTHTYFGQKGFPDLAVPVLGNGAAILPMKDRKGVLKSAQLIFPDGTKKFIKGGSIDGCAFPIGIPSDNIVLCEGAATGFSIWRSAKNCGNVSLYVLCCMSTSGIVSVAESGVSGVVCADNDEPRYPPATKKYGAGEWAAIKTGLPYVIPSGRGDFNDLEASFGSADVWKEIEPALRLREARRSG